MRLEVLGPVRLSVDGQYVRMESPMRLRLLGVLGSHANMPVSSARLVEALWESPPDSAVVNLRQYVYQLRRALGDSERIVRDQRGYRLIARDGELDAQRFETLAGEADGELATGELTRADELLTEALALWRGAEAYAEVADVALVRPVAERLREARLRVIEQRADARLRLGRHEALVAELAALVDEHPFREGSRAQWALALYRSGRRAEALEACRKGHRLLSIELGMDPGPQLRQMEQAIVSGDASLDLPDIAAAARPLPGSQDAVPLPAELPSDTAAFTGRGAEADRLCALLNDTDRQAVSVAAIAGVGGVGKSALAVHVAHRVAGQYPDGQLYVNLHGCTPEVEPVPAAAALGRLLRSLGLAEASIPADVDEAAARLRSLASGKRLLVVVDNALDSVQVRPLLPGSSTCGVLITSRETLTGVDATMRQRLDVFTDDDATALVGRLVGEGRTHSEPDATAEVIRRCGGLPLALCVAAARLASRPAWKVATLADRLADEGARLSQLQVGDRAVRASFLVSYRDLPPATARMFRLLGLLDTADIGTWVAAALAGVTEQDAEQLLDQLADVQLVETYAPGRCRLHDLLRLFARERAAVDDGPERVPALRRALHAYLATGRRATKLLNARAAWRIEVGPQTLDHAGSDLRGPEEVYAWIDAEATNFSRVIHQAPTTSGEGPAVAVALTAVVVLPLTYRGRWKDQLEIGERAVEVARGTDEPLHQAIADDMLGNAHANVGSLASAITYLERSLAAFRRTSHQRGEAIQMDKLSATYGRLGAFDDAIRYALKALEFHRAGGYRFSVGVALTNLGITYKKAGRINEAVRTHREATVLAEEIADPAMIAMTLGNLAETHRLAGRPGAAIDLFQRALQADRDAENADGSGAGERWWGLGWAHHDQGDDECARKSWRTSAEILHSLDLISGDERNQIEESSMPCTPEVILRNL